MEENTVKNEILLLIEDFKKKIETSKTLADDAIEFCEYLEDYVKNTGVPGEIIDEQKREIDELKEEVEEWKNKITPLEEKLEDSTPNENVESFRSSIILTLDDLVEYQPDLKLRESIKNFLQKIKAGEINNNKGKSLWLEVK